MQTEVTYSVIYPGDIKKLFLSSQSLFTELFCCGDSPCHTLEHVIFHVILKCSISTEIHALQEIVIISTVLFLFLLLLAALIAGLSE